MDGIVGMVGLRLQGRGCDIWVAVAREMAGMVGLRLQGRGCDIGVVVAREWLGWLVYGCKGGAVISGL